MADTVIGELAALDVEAADRDAVATALGALSRMRGWLDALELRLVQRLEQVSSFPEKVLGDATKTSLRTAERVVQRRQVTEQAPTFAGALAAGRITAGHVDALGRVLRGLESLQRTELLGRADRLLQQAQTGTVEDFTRSLRRAASRLSEAQLEDRLVRQRRDRRCRTWVDAETGMWRLSASFDPETGVRLQHHLDGTLASLFADRTPDGCPSDPLEKQDHLRALALAALIDGGRGPADVGKVGRIEPVVVVDTSPPTGPVVDWGLPVELPRRVLEELFGVTDASVVVVRNGVVLHAPGRLDLGRSTRIANRAQRRALRGLYATCAVPGCAVKFDNCKLHHVVWWEHGGTTDLHNMLPLCERHHHCVHDRGWILTLGSRRELRVQTPDGHVMTTGPPSREAA
jgi:hypothetical protein